MLNDLIKDEIASKKIKVYEAFLSETVFNWIDIECDKCTVSIESRPFYCDRGRYLLKVFSKDQQKLCIDEQDMFPRYYFKLNNLFEELHCWLTFRNILAMRIEQNTLQNV